jgi:hypothetical protein
MDANVEPSQWVQITRDDPHHSHRDAQRFRDMAAAGDDLAAGVMVTVLSRPA